MIKTYCDSCGEEVEKNIKEVSIIVEEDDADYDDDTSHFCPKCYKNFRESLKKFGCLLKI